MPHVRHDLFAVSVSIPDTFLEVVAIDDHIYE